MSTEERMRAVLDNFEARMKKLENPGSQKQGNPDPAKQAEDNFITMMQEINAGVQTGQTGDGGTDEENFIDQMKGMNQQSADSQ